MLRSNIWFRKLMELIQKEVPDLESITLILESVQIFVISNALLAKAHFVNVPKWNVVASACAGVTPASR